MTFFRSLLAVSSLTVVSRVCGFIRDTLIAMLLGSGAIADAFFVAQRLPNLFRSLFAEGAFSVAFLPLYTSEKSRNGQDAAQQFAAQAQSMLLTVVVLFSTIVIIFMPTVLQIIAPGFGDEPFRRDAAITFSRITFPYLVLVSLSALQGGVLNANGRFAAAAFAPVILNLVMIISLLAAWLLKLPAGNIVAWSFTAGGFLQLIMLAVNLRNAGLHIKLCWPTITPATKRLIHQIGPGALGSGAAQVNIMISTMLASFLPAGAISWLSYADRMNQLPLGIIGVAVATILLPVLSRHVEEKNDSKVSHYMGRSIEFCLAIGLPAAIGFGLAAEPIIRILFERGEFEATDTHATAMALAAYALGIPAFLLVKVFATGFFSRKDVKTPVRIAFMVMTINVIASIAFLGLWQHVGIALANSLALWVNAATLWRTLRHKGIPAGDARVRKRIPLFVTCSIAMGGVTFIMLQLCAQWLEKSAGFIHNISALAAVMGISVIVYAVLLHITRALTWQEAWYLIKSKQQS